MVKGMALRSRERRLMDDVRDALGASLDLRAVLKEVYPLLLSLVGADSCALVVPQAGTASSFEWIEHNLPSNFLGNYLEMVPHDFVRKKVLPRPGVVMLDSAMISRSELERNMMCHWAREVGAPLQQVMAVMLHAGDDLQSGLSLYRDRRCDFSEREQQILQELTRALANTVRNCCLYAKEKQRIALFEAMLHSERLAVILVHPPAREIDRTSLATELLNAWFPQERRCEGLPRDLIEGLAGAQAAMIRSDARPRPLIVGQANAELKVKFFPLPEPVGGPCWMLMLHEIPRVPLSWIGLSAREHEVLTGVVQGWEDRLIAQELRIAPNTVKKHVQHILDTVGVPDRKKLIVRAMRES